MLELHTRQACYLAPSCVPVSTSRCPDLLLLSDTSTKSSKLRPESEAFGNKNLQRNKGQKKTERKRNTRQVKHPHLHAALPEGRVVSFSYHEAKSSGHVLVL